MNGVIIRTMAAGLRNGLPETRSYVYRGTGDDVLTAWMDDPRLRPLCGRRMPGGQVCGRRKGHEPHCKSEQAMENDRRKSRQRRTA